MSKVKNSFILSLAIVSILGFLSISINAFTDLDLSKTTQALIFVTLGTGLMLEGGIRKFLMYSRNGFSGDEISHITAVVVGLSAVIVGILTLPFINLDNPIFNAFKGLISIIAIFVIIVETFIVK